MFIHILHTQFFPITTLVYRLNITDQIRATTYAHTVNYKCIIIICSPPLFVAFCTYEATTILCGKSPFISHIFIIPETDQDMSSVIFIIVFTESERKWTQAIQFPKLKQKFTICCILSQTVLSTITKYEILSKCWIRIWKLKTKRIKMIKMISVGKIPNVRLLYVLANKTMRHVSHFL